MTGAGANLFRRLGRCLSNRRTNDIVSTFDAVVTDTIVDDWDLEPFIEKAPYYDQRPTRSVTRVIRAIHGLPKAHRDETLGEFEVYLGRASATGTHLWNRLREHRRAKHHPYGAVLFRCPTDVAERMETLGIRVLKALKVRGQLCVSNANVHPSGYGNVSQCPDSVIYMTWRRRCTPTAYDKPLAPEIREIASELAFELGTQGRALENALMGLKRPSSDWSQPVLQAL